MKIILALLILSIIVIIHELGHFLLAKKNGITVTEFSVGMGPRIASFVHNGTRYSLKLFPIGGSCMMLGEDEAVEDEGAFHKKGVWARFSVIFAGAFFNFIFAFILALILLGDAGVDKPYVTAVKSGSPADGKLMKGDQITSINGSPIHFGREIWYNYYFNNLKDKPEIITYVRDGKKNTAEITPKWLDLYQFGINYNDDSTEANITIVTKDFPFDKAGIAVGDVIVGINGTKISKEEDLAKYFENNPLTKEKVTVNYLKAGKGEPITVDITPKHVSSGYDMGWYYNYSSTEKVSAFEVVKYSFYELKLNIVNTIKSVFYLITTKIGFNQVSGPLGIVNYVGDIVQQSQEYGFHTVVLNLIRFSILISANLGVMNLLPLPALDGGRLVFLLIEAIRRKPVPKEKEALVHMVGMVLLMILMVFVLFNDIKNITS